MTSLRLMEWDPKPPLQWDWENLIMFNTTADNSRKLQSTGWEIDGDMAIQMGSFFSQGDGSCNGGSGSDLVLVSLSKSSRSASNSSSIGEVKSSKLTFESSEAIPDDVNTNNGLASANPSGNSPTVESSVGSGEPFLGLKLGKRTYFKDSCAGDDTKPCTLSPIPASSITSSKRSKSSCHGGHARCQVEGCNLDLSSAKDYHRKHRVCESHSRCPKVTVAGLERRFCQQCSRFHGLSEFDGKKRSCRRRLSDHNARRRKPQPDSIQLIPATRSSLIYGDSPQMSSVWSRIPLGHARQNPNLTFDGASGSKYTAFGDCVFKNTKAVITDEQLHMPSNDLTTISLDQQDFKDLLPTKAKGTSSHTISQGVEDPLISSSGAQPMICITLSLFCQLIRGDPLRAFHWNNPSIPTTPPSCSSSRTSTSSSSTTTRACPSPPPNTGESNSSPRFPPASRRSAAPTMMAAATIFRSSSCCHRHTRATSTLED